MLVNNELLLRQRISLHEGKSPYAYKDSLGYFTIGIGRVCDERLHQGLSEQEMQMLLENDISNAKADLLPYTWYQTLDEVRRGVLIELNFNIGLTHLLEFKNMIAALSMLDYEKAANEMLDSLWAKQVGPIRSQDMVKRLRTGSYG